MVNRDIKVSRGSSTTDAYNASSSETTIALFRGEPDGILSFPMSMVVRDCSRAMVTDTVEEQAVERMVGGDAVVLYPQAYLYPHDNTTCLNVNSNESPTYAFINRLKVTELIARQIESGHNHEGYFISMVLVLLCASFNLASSLIPKTPFPTLYIGKSWNSPPFPFETPFPRP